MKKTYRSILLLVTLITIFLLYLLNAQFTINNIIYYSKLFLTKLFPVSFIFYVISNLFIDYGLIELIGQYFKINISKYYIFFISMISGFPSGVKYTVDLYNKGLIDLNSANKSIMYSHFPNPLFVLGSINFILNDLLLCFEILITIFISNMIIFLITKNKTGTSTFNYSAPDDFSICLNNAISNSFHVMLLIYGISLFFYLISAVITKYISISTIIYVFICGLFDLTQGVFSTTLINNNMLKVFFILIFISFGSLSIHMQVKGILSNSQIKYKNFLLGRLCGVFLSGIIFILIYIITYYTSLP